MAGEGDGGREGTGQEGGVMFVPRCRCVEGGQRTTCGSQHLPIMWVPGNEFRFSGFNLIGPTRKSQT